MSHFTTIKTKIIDKEYLKKALDDLGYAYEEGKLKCRGFAGQQTDVEIRIKPKEGFDFGFKKEGNVYVLVGDWWGIKDIDKDEFIDKLTQRYAYCVVKNQLTSKDFTFIEEKVDEKGTIEIKVRRVV